MSEDGGECPECDKYFPTDKALDQHLRDKHNAVLLKPKDYDPDWSSTCNTCSETPIVPITGLCGPCTWGEAATRGGNWEIMSNINVELHSRGLTDQSEVVDVIISRDHMSIRIPAITASDADQLATKIVAAINEHSIATAA